MEKKIILVSHGKFSEGIMHSVQMIVGENKSLSCYGMMPDEHYSTMVNAIEVQAKENLNTQFIIIADLFGGSVCNGFMTLVNLPNVKLISGMNMALVIEMLLAEAPVSDEVIDKAIESCKRGILHVSDKFIQKQGDNSDENFF